MSFNSREYWEKRYKMGSNSGSGSYGRLCEYKSMIINNFIKENNIESVIDFGCGDGNQLSYFNCDSYIGYDVSPTIIEKCKDLFKYDITKEFYLMDEYDMAKYDLSISLDVIYHLTEEEEFINYLKNLFLSSNKFVIIYSSNEITVDNASEHIKERNFTKWIKENVNDFVFIKKIKNKYKYKKEVEDFLNTSISDFFIYKNKNIL